MFICQAVMMMLWSESCVTHWSPRLVLLSLGELFFRHSCFLAFGSVRLPTSFKVSDRAVLTFFSSSDAYTTFDFHILLTRCEGRHIVWLNVQGFFDVTIAILISLLGHLCHGSLNLCLSLNSSDNRFNLFLLWLLNFLKLLIVKVWCRLPHRGGFWRFSLLLFKYFLKFQLGLFFFE